MRGKSLQRIPQPTSRGRTRCLDFNLGSSHVVHLCIQSTDGVLHTALCNWTVTHNSHTHTQLQTALEHTSTDDTLCYLLCEVNILKDYFSVNGQLSPHDHNTKRWSHDLSYWTTVGSVRALNRGWCMAAGETGIYRFMWLPALHSSVLLCV